MALESEALLLRMAARAGLLEHDKGTAALVVYAQLKKMGAAFSFGDFLVERGLLTRVAMEGLERNQREGGGDPVRTVSQLGDFELLELLGEGHSGTVFRAQQIGLGRFVAVKILSPSLAADPEALQRFLTEARICARLRNPHIVQVIHVAMSQGLYYFAMELVEGGSARALLLQTGGRLGEEQALCIVKEIASALAAAHGAGLIHRDVKPENILLTTDGHAKLTDLGIAVRLDLGEMIHGDYGLKGEFWGTPPYLAPEVIEGRGTHDPRSDLYSLGASLFEFLTGHPPFLGATPDETLRRHVDSIPADVRKERPEVSAPTAALVSRLLAKEPGDRFPDAQSLVESIELIESMRSRAAEKPAAAPPSPRTFRPHPAAPRRTGLADRRGRPKGRRGTR